MSSKFQPRACRSRARTAKCSSSAGNFAGAGSERSAACTRDGLRAKKSPRINDKIIPATRIVAASYAAAVAMESLRAKLTAAKCEADEGQAGGGEKKGGGLGDGGDVEGVDIASEH